MYFVKYRHVHLSFLSGIFFFIFFLYSTHKIYPRSFFTYHLIINVTMYDKYDLVPEVN